MRATRLAGLAFLLLLVPVEGSAKGTPAEAAVDRGNEKMEANDFDGAIKDYTAAIGYFPGYTAAWLNRGLAYLRKNDPDHAIPDFNKALGTNANYAPAYFGLGAAWGMKEEWRRAIGFYTRALELGEKDLHVAYRNRGLAWFSLGEYAKAMQDYDTYVKLEPGDFEGFSRRGLALFQAGKVEPAIADFTKSIELKPDYPYGYGTRAILYDESGDSERALADLNKVVELMPEDVFSRVWLFLVKERSHQDGLAGLAEYRKKLQVAEWPAPIVLMCLGELTPDKCLATAQDKDPKLGRENRGVASFFVARYCLLQHDKVKARDAFSKCLESRATTRIEYFCAQFEIKLLDKPKP